MTIVIYTHDDCLKHIAGLEHPENSGRLVEILGALKKCDYIDQLVFKDAPICKEENILLSHTQSYLDEIKDSAPEFGYEALDAGDTIMSSGSLNAAYRAVGAACASVDAVLDTEYTKTFCAVRPPGHHATRNQAMGFCIFNNIAIAALYALNHKKLRRVAIVDFDVHHGNGTQDVVQTDGRILYISTHQSPFYPGTGQSDEKGVGNIINIELPAGTGSDEYRDAFSQDILPALKNFNPELLFISAGFDGHEDDPLANMNLTEDDYHWIGEHLAHFAQHFCKGRVISILEGGYNHTALASSIVAYLRAFI